MRNLKAIVFVLVLANVAMAPVGGVCSKPRGNSSAMKPVESLQTSDTTYMSTLSRWHLQRPSHRQRT